MVVSLLPAQVFAANIESAKATETTVVNPFSDVKEGQWYYDSVLYAYENGLFSGVSPTTFSPMGAMTRGMYVTVLGRMVGVDISKYTAAPAFSDVGARSYYAPYVAWAVEKGITTGIGGGKFNPDGLVNREQMATFTVRFFDACGYTYPKATVTTTPKDFDNISSYAKDSVLKLWSCGMLVGDNAGNVNPGNNAIRAEAATFLTRADKHLIEAGYKETPTDKPDKKPETTPGGDDGSGTVYYEVKFAMGKGVDATDVKLPATKTYMFGTKIQALPTPFKQNGIFLGWYYDADMTKSAESGDTVTHNMTLYANMAKDTTNLAEIDTPNYVTKTDAPTNFTFQVKAASEADVKSALTIKNITAVNSPVDYTVSGGNGLFTISANYDDGQTYQAELTADSEAVFVYNAVVQPSTVRELNFITKKDEVLSLGLDGDVKYLSADKVSNMTGEALKGLITIQIQSSGSQAQENKYTGTFDYAGTDVAVGDTVAIYTGLRPDKRTKATTGADSGDVAYVTITAISGNTYTYSAAESEDVLFTPDVLPVSTAVDTNKTDGDVLTAPASALDFTDDKYAQMGIDSQTTIDEGDFIGFYTGTFGDSSSTISGYAQIKGVTLDTETNSYTITYNIVDESVVLAAMDIYQTREEEIEVTEEQKAKIEREMEEQARNSGFMEEAVQYLSAVALETDGFRELSDDMDLKSYSLQTADGQTLSTSELALKAGGSKVEVVKKEISATVAAGQILQHFEDGTGVRAELALTFELEITPKEGSDNKIVITMQAIFEQEVLLSVNVSGGAIWKKAWIFPYIYDYQLNANLDLGTFTGIGITATAKTVGPEADDGYDWKPVSGNKFEEKIIDIGKQITDLMEQQESFMGNQMVDEDGNEVEWAGSNGGGLADKYAAMMESADSSWIELFRVELFKQESWVDPYGILAYSVGADFVVSANMYITLGMTFEYGEAKRYNFSLMLFHKQSTNETISLEEAHYQFDFYVMGTIGVRAGIEFEAAVGLFSIRLDSIGITAEAGAYAQLWGYFYYSLTWSESAGKDSSASGAMFIEIGFYLKITLGCAVYRIQRNGRQHRGNYFETDRC